jgi:hypothetical protein
VATLQAGGYRFAAAYREPQAIDYLDYDFTQGCSWALGEKCAAYRRVSWHDAMIRLRLPTRLRSKSPSMRSLPPLCSPLKPCVNVAYCPCETWGFFDIIVKMNGGYDGRSQRKTDQRRVHLR